MWSLTGHDTRDTGDTRDTRGTRDTRDTQDSSALNIWQAPLFIFAIIYYFSRLSSQYSYVYISYLVAAFGYIVNLIK